MIKIALAAIWLLTGFGWMPDIIGMYDKAVWVSEAARPFIPLFQLSSLFTATVASIYVIRKNRKKK